MTTQRVPPLAGRPEGTIGPRRGYPLGALFVLMAVCGILLALWTPIIQNVNRGDRGVWEVIGASFAGGLLGLLLGFIVGLHHFRRLVGLSLGLPTGAGIGLMVGPLVLVSAQDFPRFLIAALGGSAVMVIIGTALRLGSARG